jgi:alpha-1,2-mannosyltransferase
MAHPLPQRLIATLRTGDWLTPERATVYCRIIAVLTLLDGALWIFLSHNGLDRLNKPLGADFISFWAASKLALGGHPAAAYDVSAHYAAQRAVFGGLDVGYAAYFYPPVYLLLCLPLALLPYLAALSTWLVASLAAYWAVVRKFLGERAGIALPLLAFPAVMCNAGHGQNAFITTALFGGGVLALSRRPILAGVCFGALIFKPHLGLLIPVALIAGGRWKAFAAAAATTIALASASLLAFGMQTWEGFLKVSPLARIALEQEFVGSEKMQSLFAAARLWHAPVPAAYAGQAVMTAFAAGLLVFVVRRRPGAMAEGAALTAAAVLASPFILDYDLMLLAIPLAWAFAQGRRDGFLAWEKTILAAAFLLPMVSRLIAQHLHLPLGPPVVLALLLVVARRAIVLGVEAATPVHRVAAASA